MTIYLPAFFFWVAPMAFVYHKIISQYRSTAREIKRLVRDTTTHVLSSNTIATSDNHLRL